MELTPAAEKFIRRMMRLSADGKAGFRLKVRPGGCSGLAVEFDLAPEPAFNESVAEPAGLRIFLDAESRVLVSGATVDFQETLAQTGFVVTRAGAPVQTCSPSSPMVPVADLIRPR
jgi:iron-sulfur cluster assembly accessory protein